MSIYAKTNSASWRISEGAMASDEYIYTGQISEYMIWDVTLGIMRPMNQVEIERAAIPTVSPRQIRQALTIAGLRAAVESAVAASDQDIKDWWEFATEFERSHVKVVSMCAALGVTDQQADDLWMLAASL